MYQVVLTRHGQSQWNLENRFTGWTDVNLTKQGVEEAIEAGKKLKEAGFVFDVGYTSLLKRAIHTLSIILDEMDQTWLTVVKNWRLNERHYGDLQGLNKQETIDKHGAEKVHLWRRSYDVLPPLLNKDDERAPIKDPKYKNIPERYLPLGENLELTVQRVLPYWQMEIVPQILNNKKTIISAHGNSLRALIMHLENISKKEITELEIPTGKPLVYTLDKDLNVIDKKYL
jgi:2,3-bisphosphoglycerate-dependent phosphoglycerate mutase